jgi:hypothetical protein
MTNQPNRLDLIEALLLKTAQRLDQVAEQQAANTQAIQTLTADIDVLRDYFLQTIQNAEDDREAWQSEIRRIWEYLRDRNGGSAAV